MTGLLLKRRAAPPTSFKPRPPKTPITPVDRTGVRFREIVADTEGDNLLRDTTKLHLLQFAIIDDGEWDGQVYTFRNNDEEDSIEAGLEWLKSADVLVFHNAIGHDLPVIEKLYPDFFFPETTTIRDTLVLSRMICADEKDRDFRRIEKGTMPGKYLGQHSVGAWGARFGMDKGDYKDAREALAKEKGLTDKADIHRFVWGEWNLDMEEYGETDVKIGVQIWQHLKSKNWAETAVRLEHRVQHVMFLTEQFGFPFDRDGARRLEAEVQVEYDKLTQETVEHFGFWFAAKKWVKDQEPRTEYGEDGSRRVWAEVTNPTKTIHYKDPLRPDRIEGQPFCPVVQKEFNPRSRPMIIDRLKTIYEWEPVDFTEKGNPTLDEDVMGNLAKFIPICESLSEIFFLGKLLGALSTGDNAWLTKCGPDGRMHPYFNCGGTGTGRGSHSSPNIAQVPKVLSAKVRNEDGSYNKKVIDKKTGEPYPWVFKEDGTEKKSTILYGRAGRYGFECRSLFHAPEGWVQVGADLKGVELRCLAARLSPWDGGAYIKEVLEGDPHTKNWHAFKVETRDQAKTLLYAIMYGAGDEKAGSIALPPSASSAQMKAHGKVLKANLQKGIPAFGHLMKKVAKDAKRGFMDGLDGRKIWVRSSHAALNYQLQSDGALLAKAWVVLAYDMIEEAGYVWGVDFAFSAWVHDEIQAFARTREIAEHIAEIMCEAALEAGRVLNYPAPIEADAKIGMNWAECH